MNWSIERRIADLCQESCCSNQQSTSVMNGDDTTDTLENLFATKSRIVTSYTNNNWRNGQLAHSRSALHRFCKIIRNSSIYSSFQNHEPLGQWDFTWTEERIEGMNQNVESLAYDAFEFRHRCVKKCHDHMTHASRNFAVFVSNSVWARKWAIFEEIYLYFDTYEGQRWTSLAIASLRDTSTWFLSHY